MAKLTLTDIASTQASSLLSVINGNNALIEAAIENTLSRDGTAPNTMEDTLDMNNERIINLPEPVTATEPIRKGEFDTYLNAMDETITASIAAVQALDDFTDLWLGVFPFDPTLDNDGDPLQEGALYFNNSINRLKVYASGSWSTPLSGSVIDSTDIDAVPSGADVSLTIQANAVTNAKFRQSAATSVVGRSANSTGNVADIAASADGQFLMRTSGALSFAAPTATQITNTPAGNIAATTVQAALNELDTEKQPLDATLTSLAAFNTNGFIVQTAADTFAGRTLSAPAAGLTITNPAGTAGNPTFALANDLAALEALSGTNTIYYRSAADTWTAVTIGGLLSFSGGTLTMNDAELTAIAGLTSAADKGIQFTGAGTAGTFDLTTFAKTILDDPDAATARATLGAQAGIQFKDEGSNIGTSGAVTAIDFVGTGVTASHSSGTVTVTISGGGGGGLSDGDYGDITVSAGGGALTIDNDVVTFAKMQNVSANSVPARAAGTSGDLSEVSLSASQLLGRGSSGDIAAITLGTGLSMSGTTISVSNVGITRGQVEMARLGAFTL